MSGSVSIDIPCGCDWQQVQVPAGQFAGAFLPKKMPVADDPLALLESSIRHGLMASGIPAKAYPGASACIVVTDRTRTTPNQLIVPILLNELNALGVQDEDICILIGLGMHGKDDEEAILQNLGRQVVARVEVFNHEPDNQAEMIHLGTTALGTPVELHHRFARADIRIGTGNINPCMLAGWSAGGKIVLPGVASRDCIYGNHKRFTRTLNELGIASLMGIMPPENVVRSDLEEAADISGIDMVVNTVLDWGRRLVSVECGHHIAAHRAAVEAMKPFVEVTLPQSVDILIAGVGEVGYECSLFQGGSRVCGGVDRYLNDGGTLIMVNECREGIYEGFEHEQFREWMRRMPAPAELTSLTESGAIGGEKSCVLYTFSWLLHQKKCRIIVVTEYMSPTELGDIHLEHAGTAQGALDRALARHGTGASIAALPFAGLVLPTLQR